MTNRGKFSNNRHANKTNNNNSQKDDDNCSVVCYKDSDNGQVDIVRIHQQILCSPCNSMRGTLLLYCKHILDSNHREKVKKLSDEKCFTPTVFEQAIHLAFHNNFCYQSDKFHFLYKNINEESASISQSTKSSTITNESETEKKEINNNQQKSIPTNTQQQKNIQVTLVFQDKNYSKIGTAIPQIREQLLKDMLTDRAADIATLPADTYYTKKNLAPYDAYYNIPNSSVILTMAEEQSQVMIKKQQQQQQQEPFNNGHMSPAEISRDDNGVEKNTAMTTHEISTAEKIDVDEQLSCVDDIINVCKDVLNKMIIDVYSKCDESKREREFLFGIARRRYKKRKAFFCDICSAFLSTEDMYTEHRNGSYHLEKARGYQTDFLPWRRAMQESLITGKSMKEIMGTTVYDNYKATMAVYLAPNSVVNHGRFCCAYCEFVFPDQWLLEKHLHTIEHKNKQTSSNHKELVPHFADIIILPTIYKFNGMKDLSQVPEDIRKEQQWCCVTRKQLDDDTNLFLQKHPCDQFEGVTSITNNKVARKKKPFISTSTTQKSRNNNISTRNQQGKRGGFNRSGRGQYQKSTAHRGGAVKRSFPATPLHNKRFRADLNNSFPGANRGSGPMRNYEMNQFNNYGHSTAYNNGNDHWASRYPTNQQQQQQRQEYFEGSNFETRSMQSNNNNGYYGNNRPPQLMSSRNNYDNDRQTRFNGTSGGYANQQTNYEPPFNRAATNTVNEYYPEPTASLLGGPPNRSHHRTNNGSGYELMHPAANNQQRSQQQQQPSRSSMGQVHHQNQNSFGAYGVNNNNHNNNTNSPFFSSSGNQQQNQMGTNGPSVRSYADYRSSSGLPATNTHSSMYPPLSNTQNLTPSVARTFDEFGLSTFAQGSSNSFGRSNGPSFGNEESRYGAFGHQNQMEQSSQAPWHSSSSGVNNVRGRGRGRGGTQLQSMNKPAGSTFSYRSSNNTNNSPMRGRGVGRNGRNFGSHH